MFDVGAHYPDIVQVFIALSLCTGDVSDPGPEIINVSIGLSCVSVMLALTSRIVVSFCTCNVKTALTSTNPSFFL